MDCLILCRRTAMAFFVSFGAAGCMDATQSVKKLSDQDSSATIAKPENGQQTNSVDKKDDYKQESVVIPLDKIWAYNMPGTRPMEDGMRDKVFESAEQKEKILQEISKGLRERHEAFEFIAPEGKLLHDIRKTLALELFPGTNLIAWKETKPGFAVLGTGMNALREAHAVLVKGQKPRTSFLADEKITIVFFSNRCGRYVHLQKVERTNRIVEIQYQFIPHPEKYVTQHIALIPLGNVTSGEIHMNIKRSAMEDKHPVTKKQENAIICRPFSFFVSESLSK